MAQEVPTTDKFGFPAVPCSRCFGEGGFQEYGHVDNGVCFKCNGAKVVVVDEKAQAAKAAFLAARVQLKTVADLKEGDTFALGGVNCVVRWAKFEGLGASTNGILVRSNKGNTSVKDDSFPVRLYVPTDVKDYLVGLV